MRILPTTTYIWNAPTINYFMISKIWVCCFGGVTGVLPNFVLVRNF
ncbi:hypothetical protein SLEP1_g31427 [Rubroshorea leprosula]|uniref:Uncharacterized protein n=1 Tax=Rubroshorea leprosula TaxID=152421 RepID=A0AAV5K821_9ROSI|nr:hypothetical protein SLEP1_g31427 [Rubroshorea leprosula]